MRRVTATQNDHSNRPALRHDHQRGKSGRPNPRPFTAHPIPPFQWSHQASQRSLVTKSNFKLPSSLQPPRAPSDPLKVIQDTYAALAATYDASNDGWHVPHAESFITQLFPPLAAGSTVLDLACGTGLVTYAAADGVGSDGVVVGVDVSEGMLEVARRKTEAHVKSESGRERGTGGSRAPITWIQGDIASGLLFKEKAIRDVATQRGGFDLITCCSAFILLEDRCHCLARWAKLLKPGGRIVLDVPTEDASLARLWFHDLRLALGVASVLDVGWVRGVGSLEEVVRAAGLRVQKSWRTRSWVPEKPLGREERDGVFERNVVRDKAFADRWGSRRLRDEWKRVWDGAVGEDGRLWNGYALYVVVGKKSAN